jgi:5-methylthioadenosine/S-adenosylhomocysteine deaminase
MADILIRSARVLQLKNEIATILENHDIRIDGNRITAIEPTGTTDPSHAKTVIDANGQVAMPGFINTHAHVAMVLWRGMGEDVNLLSWFNDYIWPLENNLVPEDVYWGTQLGLMEMIEAGITSVSDHYWYMDHAARAVEKAGTRALLGQAMFSDNGMGQIEETAEFAQRWNGQANGRIRTILAPHAPYTCTDDFLKATAKKAETIGTGIHIHVAETLAQTQASLDHRGKTPIEVLEDTGVLNVPTILAHAIGVRPTDLEILSSTSAPVGIAQCPKTYAKLGMGYANLVDYRKAGLAIGLGTDGAVSNNTLDLWESMRLTAMGQKQTAQDAEVITIPQALTIATQESAQVYGQGEELGDLAVGKLADVILVDVSGVHHQPLNSITANLVYSARAGDVQTVICDGQVVMQDRQHKTLDKGEIMENILPQMRRLRHRDNQHRIQTYNP